jgi:hypothetical protein
MVYRYRVHCEIIFYVVQVLGLTGHHESLVIPTPDSLETDVQLIATAVK